MVKMSIFDKTNDLLVVDAFENVFQRRSSEVLLSEVRTIQVYASLSVEQRRTHMLVGPVQIEDDSELSENDQFSIY